MVERMGITTVKEHLPKPERSWIAATRGRGFFMELVLSSFEARYVS
jgi:hypothetical protein